MCECERESSYIYFPSYELVSLKRDGKREREKKKERDRDTDTERKKKRGQE